MAAISQLSLLCVRVCMCVCCVCVCVCVCVHVCVFLCVMSLCERGRSMMIWTIICDFEYCCVFC
jgi:hypothetical protein